MSVRGFLSGIGRALFWSELRALQSARQAKENIGGALVEMQERIRRLRRPSPYAGEIGGLSAREKWEFLYAKFEWTPAALEEQRKAVRRGRRVSIGLFVFLVALLIMSLRSIPWLIALVVVGALAFGAIRSALVVIQLALYEAQIERHEIVEFRDFLGWPDFWWRLVR